jgi:Lipocalin-like domain
MKSIVGTWRLVETRAKNDAGERLEPPYGPQPMGTVWFSDHGRMQSVLCDGRANLPGAAEREYNSYCGNYTFDGKRLVTRVDAASDPKRMGTDQVRGVAFEGERMVLTPPPQPWRGGMQHRELVWQKIA